MPDILAALVVPARCLVLQHSQRLCTQAFFVEDVVQRLTHAREAYFAAEDARTAYLPASSAVALGGDASVCAPGDAALP